MNARLCKIISYAIAQSDPEKRAKFLGTAVIVALFVLTASHQSRGNHLAWEATEREFTADFNQKTATVFFNFLNEGDRTVHIQGLRSPCGCLTYKLEKKTIDPEEGAKLKVNVDLQDRRGEIHKTLFVHLKSDKLRVKRLSISGVVRSPIKIEPRFLIWHLNDKPQPKQARISLDEGNNLRIKNIDTKVDGFQVSVKGLPRKTEENKKFVVEVKPEQTRNRNSAVIKIHTAPPPPPGRSYTIRVYVFPSQSKKGEN